MLKLLFAHDGYIREHKSYLESKEYSQEIIMDYKYITDDITFMVRDGENIDSDIKFNKINKNEIEFVKIKNIKRMKNLGKLKDEIKKIQSEVEKCDILIARIPSDIGFIAISQANLIGKTTVVEVVGCPWDSYKNHSFIGKIMAPIYRGIQKRSIEKSDYVHYVTNEFLQERYPTSGSTLSCSDVQINNLSDYNFKKRISKIEKTNKKTMIIGTIGNLSMRYKGFDRVIKSVTSLNKQGYKIQYHILGEGSNKWLNTIIKKYDASSYVKIFTGVSHNKVFEWLEDIDLYIQPSKTEGLPRALIEAMSCGIPAMGTNVGGIPELINSKYLIPNNKNSSHTLQKKIINLSIEQMLEMSKYNYKKSKDFVPEKLKKKKNEFYEQVKRNVYD